MLLLAPVNACLSSPPENSYNAEQQDYSYILYILFNSEKQLGLRPFAIKVHLTHLTLRKVSCARSITKQWKTKFNLKAVISNYC